MGLLQRHFALFLNIGAGYTLQCYPPLTLLTFKVSAISGPSVLLTAARVLVRSAIDGPAVNAIRQIRVIPDHTREL